MKKRTGYFGYSETSEFLRMDSDDFREFIIGRVALSFIKKDLELELRKIISMVMAWAVYNDKGI